jgi:hypothetical protein
MSSNQASHRQNQVSGQPEHTPFRRADSHHEQHHSVDMHDSNDDSAPVFLRVGSAGSNQNRNCFLYAGVVYTHIPDKVRSVEGASGDYQRTQPSRHAHTSQSAYHPEPSSTHDSVYGSHDDAPHEQEGSEHTRWPAYPSSSSDETHPAPSDLSDDTPSEFPLTAENLERNVLLEAQHPAQNATPLHAPHLTPMQVLCTNQYGNAQHDESIFDTTCYHSPDEVLSIDQRIRYTRQCTHSDCDSMIFIEGGLLNDDIRPELLRHVEQRHENVAGHFKNAARRVAHRRE